MNRKAPFPVLWSVHLSTMENPADFLVEFAHRCIDMGAHAVLGHGPHLLRPLEIYKNCPIFYSLGDFMLHNESVTFAPEDMYEKYGSIKAPIFAHIMMNLVSVFATEYQLMSWMAAEYVRIGAITVVCAAVASSMFVLIQRME